jgi:Na+-translocating ferredoxin:NAD+ oxidoreductase subunit C
VIKTFPRGGVHPEEHKLSAGKKLRFLPLPEIVNIPLTQHLGAPAKAIVAKGDKVKTGQLIGQSEGFVSANVHSSVSGIVTKVDLAFDSSGYKKPTISIKVEADEWMENIDRSLEIKSSISLAPDEIIKKIAEAGIVGMGGAAFPTQVKLTIPKGKHANVVIINGVECEPYLTSDHALMLEKGEEIIVGVKLLMRALEVEKAIIGIENNKPDAIENLLNLASRERGISVQPLQVKYPQGGEKQLIKSLINREVPSGGLPIDIGVVVFNVASTFAIYEAVQKNKPLFERAITITGLDVQDPGNFWVRLGTPVKYLVDAAGGYPNNTGRLISGGPMMGKALNSLDIPLVKGSSGILLMREAESHRKPVINCIRCGQCISVCPMGLEPYLLMGLTENEIYDRLEIEKVMNCMECGSCSFTCPANRPLLDYIRLGKNIVTKRIRTRLN